MACSVSTAFATDDISKGPKTEKITINDARDKRQLSNFNDDGNQQPQIQRRITHNYSPFGDSLGYQYNAGDFAVAASSYPNVQSYGPPYQHVQPSGYIGGGYPHPHQHQHQHQHQHSQPQYIEAPEPIIEIIIKESNETLPTPEPLKLQPVKKKKEQVQVFYVKYNKDPKKGLLIDDPIPGKFIFNKLLFFYFHQKTQRSNRLNAIPFISFFLVQMQL